jgi:hypothetical protein
VLLGGTVVKITAAEAASLKRKSWLRFVVASDGHYGQAGTDSDLFYETLIREVSDFHKGNALDFCVINGDIIHDKKELLTTAKTHLDKLPVK